MAGDKVQSLESLKTILSAKQGEIKISLDLINSIKSHLLCLLLGGGEFWARWVVLSVALTLPFLNQI